MSVNWEDPRERVPPLSLSQPDFKQPGGLVDATAAALAGTLIAELTPECEERIRKAVYDSIVPYLDIIAQAIAKLQHPEKKEYPSVAEWERHYDESGVRPKVNK